MNRSEKLIATGSVLFVLALCLNLNIPAWAYGATLTLAAGAASGWSLLERKMTAWMPDSQFPVWLLNQMSSAG